MNFADMREFLREIAAAVGPEFLVSCSWDGVYLQVAVGRGARLAGDNWRKPWVMKFDSEDDYSIDPATLIAELARSAKEWFGCSKDEADEIVRLLKKCAEK